jgi:hypothetical protein
MWGWPVRIPCALVHRFADLFTLPFQLRIRSQGIFLTITGHIEVRTENRVRGQVELGSSSDSTTYGI